MSSRKHKLTDDEIEAEVLKDLDDPSAWGDPIYVPPSKTPRPAWVTLGRHLELSARFHVLSVLHRLGAEASLTNTNSGSIDIKVIQAPGRVLTIDVQTLIGTTDWFIRPFAPRKNHYVAFVLFPKNAAANPADAPEVLVFPSVRLKELLGTQKSGSVSIQSLGRKLGITNPWSQLVAEAA